MWLMFILYFIKIPFLTWFIIFFLKFYLNSSLCLFIIIFFKYSEKASRIYPLLLWKTHRLHKNLLMYIHHLIWILYLKSSSCLLMRSLSKFHLVLRSLSSRAFAFSSFFICLFLRFIRSCSAKVMRYWGPIRTRSWWAELTMTLLLLMYCFWELLLLSAELCVTKKLTVSQKN